MHKTIKLSEITLEKGQISLKTASYTLALRLHQDVITKVTAALLLVDEGKNPNLCVRAEGFKLKIKRRSLSVIAPELGLTGADQFILPRSS